MSKRFKFQPSPVARAVVTFVAMMAATSVTQAGPGFGDAYDLNNNPFIIETFFASSPSGNRQWMQIDANGELVLDASGQPIPDPLHGAPASYDPANRLAFAAAVAAKYPGGYPGTGAALRKFVDPLPLPAGHPLAVGGNAPKVLDGTAKYIPVAVAAKWVNPQGVQTNDDYYEIAVVEYKEKFHSDLAKPTTLRGYIQIDQFATNGLTAPTGWVSKALPLYYPNTSGKVVFAAGDTIPVDAKPIMIEGTDANGKRTGTKVQAIAVDAPHYLGPIIAATSTNPASVAAGLTGAPTRLKFLNLLPAGRAETTVDANGKLTVGVDATTGLPLRHGDSFIPLDPSVAGSGYGTDGAHTYSQNRALIHLHGGDNPWISDGTPHQWITPVGEADPLVPGSIASLNAEPAAGPLDPGLLPEFLRGPGAINVPDMNDPGPGAMTYYFPNGQSARMEWYHDHTVGMTRLNVYAGMASAYLLTDAAEQKLIADGALPGPEATIPLILQEKTFVPNDIALQDSRWDVNAWGGPSDLWFPHVYETVQDPNQATNFNAVGRWHWGPWFWPSFPSLYNLPTGSYGDVTLTPEAWMDTPVINGVAYPTLEVEAKPYRMRLLNASNDRTFTFNLFKADDAVQGPAGKTEVKMVPVTTWTNLCSPGVTKSDGVCTPETWTTDVYGHAGGVPDPTTQGPTLYQVASEGGFLPGVAKKDATPISYLLDKGRAAVLNTDYGNSGLHLGNGERADVVVDFSGYPAGTTFIVYNDAGAPVPAADPRNEYFTGYGDNSPTGGAEDTLPGYGPNTRTLMRIVVKAAAGTATPVNPTALDTQLKAAYASAQEPPVVAQSAYNSALGKSWTDTKAFASIFTGSLKEPSFNFVPGTEGAVFNSILVQSPGSGYTRTPSVTITSATGNGSGATAVASLKIDKVHIINPGSGYKIAPVVTMSSNGQGSGAGATTTLAVDTVNVTAGGSGYTDGGTITFSAPSAPLKPGHRRATGTIQVNATGQMTGVTITDAGVGYATAPTTFTVSNGGTGAKVSTTGRLGSIDLDIPDPLNPGSAGGGGYTDLSTAASEPTNPAPGQNIRFTAPPAGGTAPTAGFTGRVFDVTLTNAGSGYDATPSVAIVASPNEPAVGRLAPVVDATAATDTAINATNPQGSILVKTKAIQELFDPTYGRLNATFGVEIPYTSALTQTTIPLGYVDAPTEEFADGETQIWKITHNGVDTHPIHFHLMNVQLINRVGWDNFVTPPEPNELGWKETIKMSPLEDVIVAVRAKKPKLGGFGLPNSYRLLDPAQPEGAMTGFTQIDPYTGMPAAMTNVYQDFGWEYVWHCHILGHEENDFMRPVIFHANEAIPLGPTLAAPVPDASSVALAWTDNSSTEYKFEIQRADVMADGVTLGAFVPVGTELANATSFIDAAPVNLSGGSSLAYKVVAVGANGAGESGVMVTPISGGAVAAPTGFTAMAQSGSQVGLNWTDVALNETSYVLQRTVGGVTSTFTLAANAVNYTDTGLPADTQVDYVLSAANATNSSPTVSATTFTLGAPPLTSLTATANSATQVTLGWATAPAVRAQATTGFAIVRTGGAGTVTFTAAASATGYVDTTASQNTSYTYTVNAVNASGIAPVAGAASQATVSTPYAAAGSLTGLSALANSATLVTVSWTGGVPATQYLVERCTATAANFNCTAASSVWLPAVTVTAPATSFADATVVANTTYAYRVTASNGPNVSNTLTTNVTTPGGLLVNAPSNLAAAVSFAHNRVTLTWLDNATNETAFIVERSIDGVNYSQVGTVAARTGSGRTSTFTDTAVSAGVTYFYQVRAQNVTGAVVTNSAPSNVAQVDFFLNAPTGLTATIASATRVTLNWTDTSTAETSFAVWRSDNGAAAVRIGTVTRTTAQGTATGGTVTFSNNNSVATPLAVGHSYAYYVTAVNGAVVSPSSNVASVDFLAPAAPATPSATVTVTSTTRANVTVSWAAVPGASSYTVQRITPTGALSTVVTNTTNLSVTQTRVTRNATVPYTYQVRANGLAGSSAYTPVSVLVN